MAAQKADFVYNDTISWRANCSAAKKWMRGWLNIEERDPAVFGPKYWKMLHTICSKYPKAADLTPEDIETAGLFIFDFLNNLPCANCRNDFAQILSVQPTPPAVYAKYGRATYFFLSYMLHNYVTEKVYPGRPFPKFTEICSQYGVDPDELLEKPKKIIQSIDLW